MTTLTFGMKRTGLVGAIAVLIGVSACSNKTSTSSTDASLKADLAAAGGQSSDLQLAPAASKSQVVVSAIEGGPQAAPKKAAPAKVPKPSPKAATHVAVRQTPTPAPAAEPERIPAPAPVRAQEPAPAPQEPVIEAPRPTPAPAPRQDGRVYKTEGEIFKQMPWIRP